MVSPLELEESTCQLQLIAWKALLVSSAGMPILALEESPLRQKTRTHAHTHTARSRNLERRLEAES